MSSARQDNSASTTPSLKSSGTGSTSFSFSTPPTPPKLFLEGLFDNSGHSPPHNDNEVPKMSKEEVEKRMQALLIYPLSWLSRERYLKLAWVVGVGMDVCFEEHYGTPQKYAMVEIMLLERSAMGKRFSAVYNAEDDELSEASGDDRSFDDLVRNLHQDWAGMNDDISFTLLGSADHPNIELFHKYQRFGGCFAHSPLLSHWLKVLWQDPATAAKDAEFIHVSKFARHAFSGQQLFKLIVFDSGGDHTVVASDVMPTCKVSTVPKSDWTFEGIRKVMDEHGPVMVGLEIFESLMDDRIVSHRGGSPLGGKDKDDQGHSMVVIGVRRESREDFPEDLENRCLYDEKLSDTKLEKLSTVLLIQNFWEEKEFFEMDLQYLQEVNGVLHSLEGRIDVTANAYKATRETANLIRSAYCASPVERPSPRKRLYY